MNFCLDDTHDSSLRSWVDSANQSNTDFPVQNLPIGRFRRDPKDSWSVGVAIGEEVLDLARSGLIETPDIGVLMRAGWQGRRSLRQTISKLLRQGSESETKLRAALMPQRDVELGLPCEIGDYTDFYTSVHHATTVGKQFRPDNPLLPNYKWVPIGYHGRASSIHVSGPGRGHTFRRPVGQTRLPETAQPTFGKSLRMDYELELGVLISGANDPGEHVPMARAEEQVLGLTLFNDWSSRDIQGWEYQPLGPFLSKNFASTLSPWVVTLDALAPFRKAFVRPKGDPAPMAYLDSADNSAYGAFDIELEVWLQTDLMRREGHSGDQLSRSNYADAYWTVAQLVTHHTVNGCNLREGDLFGSGTLSGPEQGQGGSLLELSQGGKKPIRLSNGETRTFLEDEDTVILRAYCQRNGFQRIGFGECRGTMVAAREI